MNSQNPRTQDHDNFLTTNDHTSFEAGGGCFRGSCFSTSSPTDKTLSSSSLSSTNRGSRTVAGSLPHTSPVRRRKKRASIDTTAQNNNQSNDENSRQNGGTVIPSSRGTTASSLSKKGGRRRKHKQDMMDDAMLAQELNELSVQERNHAMEEVHGVAKNIEETPELIERSLNELTVAIRNLSRGKRKALDKAFFLRPSYESTDVAFRRMFLRADRYDATKAALRMADYFTNKLFLFGEEKLAKKITLDDMDDDDMAAIRTGAIRTLPERDQAGRTVWFIAQKHYAYKDWKNQIRYAWYQAMAALESEEAQINGMVDVVYCVDMADTESNFNQMIVEGGHLLVSLPFRMAGLHFCYSDARLRPAMGLIQLVVGQQIRIRFRTHFGSHLEVQYALMTFGIPMKSIPIRDDGTLKPEINEQYLRERQIKDKEFRRREEDESLRGGVILYPNLNDVLLGRGRPFQQYAGNQRLNRMVDAHREQYQRIIDRFEKTCLSMDIVKLVQESGGRFLQRTQHGWERVTDFVAREKVSHSFRTKPSSSTSSLASSVMYPMSPTTSATSNAKNTAELKGEDLLVGTVGVATVSSNDKIKLKKMRVAGH